MAGYFNLLKSVKVIRVQDAAVAGTSDLTGTTVDTQGYDACMFVYGVGTLTSTQVTKLKCQSGTDSAGSGASDIQGSATAAMADGDSNKLLILDVVRPAPGPSTGTTSYPSGTNPSPGFGGGYVPNRYLTPVLDRGTANAVVDFGIAILYNTRKAPLATQDTTVSVTKTVVDAPQGTA